MTVPRRIDVHHFDEATRGAIARDNALALLPRRRDRVGGAEDA
jgi:hypothetical protein